MWCCGTVRSTSAPVPDVDGHNQSSRFWPWTLPPHTVTSDTTATDAARVGGRHAPSTWKACGPGAYFILPSTGATAKVLQYFRRTRRGTTLVAMGESQLDALPQPIDDLQPRHHDGAS